MRVSNSFSYIPPASGQNPVPTIAQRSARPKESHSGDSVSSVSANLVEARAARVAELRGQYRAGKYKVEPQEVSSKIIEKHLDS